MKALAWISCILLAMTMLYVASDFPVWGDPQSPAALHVSPHYIEQAVPETKVPNIVSALLADYRGYDTMFETAVVFTAAMACFFILRMLGCEMPGQKLYRHLETGILIRTTPKVNIPIGSSFKRVESVSQRYDFITAKISRLLVPFLQIFALYVIAHGHYSPGGGFQGGVMFGASFILIALTGGLSEALKRLSEQRAIFLAALGVLIYAGTGLLCMFLGKNFLDYHILSQWLPDTTAVKARYHAMLIVEIGVAFTVTAIMFTIYATLSSKGRMRGGL